MPSCSMSSLLEEVAILYFILWMLSCSLSWVLEQVAILYFILWMLSCSLSRLLEDVAILYFITCCGKGFATEESWQQDFFLAFAHLFYYRTLQTQLKTAHKKMMDLRDDRRFDAHRLPQYTII